MLLSFLAGIKQTWNFGLCVTASVFIFYFTLVTFMWMAAEALLIFQKLVIVFMHITTKYIVVVSVACWGELVLYTMACFSVHVLIYQFNMFDIVCMKLKLVSPCPNNSNFSRRGAEWHKFQLSSTLTSSKEL